MGYYAVNDNSCWVGDPSLTADPTDPDKFYWVGMIWCQGGSDIKGEIYFCTNTGTPDDANNWSCSILPPNDNWSYFKDKPWIIARNNGGSTELLVVFTADGFGGTSLGRYEMLSVKSTDGGNSWQPPLRIDPGYTSTVAYTFYDPSTGRVHMSKNCIYCYDGYDIVIEYYTSDDFGTTWNYRSGLIGTVPSGQTSRCPHFDRPVKIGSGIAAAGQNIVVAGIADSDTSGRCDLHVKYSSDGGSSWSRFLMGTYEYIHPFVATDGSDSFYVMVQARNKSTGVWQTQMYIHISPGTWQSIYRVSDHDYTMNENPAGHDYNTILYLGGNLFAIWGDDYYEEDAGAIYYASTVDPTPISTGEDYAQGMEIEVVDGGIRSSIVVDVFESSGRRIAREVGGFIPLKPGIYLIRHGERTRKILVR